MRILLSPVGEQDPHCKPDKNTGDATLGSALAICKETQPDLVLLLPTRCPQCANFPDTRCGSSDRVVRRDCTYQNALATKEEIIVEWPHIGVKIEPQDMEAANNYEEALQVYGDTLVRLARANPDAELLVNASSGTPAIKVTCLLCVAEGRILATPWYADDPTKSRREDLVRSFNVTFLRESALLQRICSLIHQGHFGLAQEPLEELNKKSYSPARKLWAGYWKHWMEALQGWDERPYGTARQELAALRSKWLSPPDDVVATLKTQQQMLDKLANPQQHKGLLAWDWYYQARRLQTQGHLAAAMQHLWIAIENVTLVHLKRQYPDVNTSRLEICNALDILEAKKDAGYTKLWAEKWKGKSIEQWFHPLRRERNNLVHNGKPAKLEMVLETEKLAHCFLSAFGCVIPADYPLSPEALSRLASLFSANCGF